MSLKNGSQPAFPVPGSPWSGFTKREYMALMILQGSAAGADSKYFLPSVDGAVRLADMLIAKLDEVQS